MPELPDLEAIKDFLNERLAGARITTVEVRMPIVLRRPPVEEFRRALFGAAFARTERRGKFLLIGFSGELVLAINPMLTGRLQFAEPGERLKARTCFTIGVEGGELRYYDRKQMGKAYLVPERDLGAIPGFEEMGPEALSIGREEFHRRILKHRGMLKNVLVNAECLAGIGNAYADEILFAAGFHPYHQRSRLAAVDVDRLYDAMRSVLAQGIDEVASRHGPIDHKVRDFLKVHGKGGQPCPTCGYPISQITAGNRLTNFCRKCQR